LGNETTDENTQPPPEDGPTFWHLHPPSPFAVDHEYQAIQAGLALAFAAETKSCQYLFTITTLKNATGTKLPRVQPANLSLFSHIRFQFGPQLAVIWEISTEVREWTCKMENDCISPLKP
jgi:hypothetical protein